MSHTPEPMFLLDGMRFKLSFQEVCCDECGSETDRVTIEPLGMYANELDGRWVALVPAEDDSHMELTNLKSQRDELLAALTEARDALQFANDSPGGGISDTILMMHRPETLFDFMDSAIASVRGAS